MFCHIVSWEIRYSNSIPEHRSQYPFSMNITPCTGIRLDGISCVAGDGIIGDNRMGGVVYLIPAPLLFRSVQLRMVGEAL